MKDNKEYEIIKSNREDWVGVTFQCVIINKRNNMPPKWFQEFEKRINDRFEKIEKENDKRWAGNDARWEEQMKFNKRVEEFMKQQLEFNKYVLDVFKRNNLK